MDAERQEQLLRQARRWLKQAGEGADHDLAAFVREPERSSDASGGRSRSRRKSRGADRPPQLKGERGSICHPFADGSDPLASLQGDEERAFVILVILADGQGPPPEALVADLADRIGDYPEVGPWHIGIAHGLGAWRPLNARPDGWSRVLPLACGAAHCLVAASVAKFARGTVDLNMLGGARLLPDSIDLVATWIFDRILKRDCGCSRHDSKHLGCRAGEDGIGTGCRRRCCRHSLDAYERPRPDPRWLPRIEPLGVFFARMVGGDFLLHHRKRRDFPDTLYVSALCKLDAALSWKLPGREPTSLEVQIGDVEFRRCGNSDDTAFEGDRCPVDGTPVNRTTPREVKEEWLFVRRVEGWFQYDEDYLIECDGGGKGCGAFFAPDQHGTTCHGCGRPRSLRFRPCPDCGTAVYPCNPGCGGCEREPMDLVEGARRVSVKTVSEAPRATDEQGTPD